MEAQLTGSFRLVFLTMLMLLASASYAPASVRLAASVPEPAAKPRELVVLVHGMGRSSFSMIPLSWTLQRAGYDVLNWGYSSTCCGISELGSQLQRDLRERPDFGATRVHFVGHSLGNIIIRWVLAHEESSDLAGRVVMLAPPNQGSRAADRFTPSLGWLLRPLPELRSHAMRSSTSYMLPREIDVGVIAGRFDGKVSVDETRLDGMDAHVVVSAAHPFLMLRSDVHQLVLDFIRDGEFHLSR
jgi:pimeloyl-ACP methyl ester carboxylesterase